MTTRSTEAAARLTRDVRQWAYRARGSLDASPAPHDSIDLDDLLAADYDARTAVDRGVEALVVLRDLVAAWREPFLPRLAVRLDPSPALDPRLPDISEHAAWRDPFFPPGLYLFRPDVHHLRGDYEEYRVSFPEPPLALFRAHAGLEATYTCFRNGSSGHCVDDYARTLWLTFG